MGASRCFILFSFLETLVNTFIKATKSDRGPLSDLVRLERLALSDLVGLPLSDLVGLVQVSLYQN